MRFEIYSSRDLDGESKGSSDSLIEAGAKTGDGVLMSDFMNEHDGSTLVWEFDVPPADDEHVPAIELTPEQCWLVARLVFRGFIEGRFQTARESDV